MWKETLAPKQHTRTSTTTIFLAEESSIPLNVSDCTLSEFVAIEIDQHRLNKKLDTFSHN